MEDISSRESKEVSETTIRFLSFLPSSNHASDGVLNEKILQGNLAVLEAEAAKKAQEAERDKNEVQSRKKDLEFFEERDDATKVTRIDQAKTKEECKLLKEKDGLASQSWTNEKNQAALDDRRKAAVRQSEVDEISVHARHNRAMTRVWLDYEMDDRQQALDHRKTKMRMAEKEQETSDDMAEREAKLRVTRIIEKQRRAMQIKANIETLQLQKRRFQLQQELAENPKKEARLLGLLKIDLQVLEQKKLFEDVCGAGSSFKRYSDPWSRK